MAGFDTGAVLDRIAESVGKLAESVKIIGEPLTAGEKLIIPAVMARVGYGAGGGSGAQAGEEGGGNGGGGFVSLTPVFFVVDAQGERIHTVPSGAETMISAAEKLKDAFGKVFHREPKAPEDAGD